MGYWGWDDIGSAISQAANAVGNFVSQAANNFINFSNSLSDAVSNLRWGSYGRPTPQPYTGARLRPAPSGPDYGPPLDMAVANSGGSVPGNNATSGTGSPVAQNWDQRPGMFVNYWGTFLPWGKVLAPAGKLIAWVAKPLGKVLARHPEYTAKFGSDSFLATHFGKHGEDFGAATSSQYEKMAAEFLQSPLSGSSILQKVRTNGDTVRFNSTTQEFGILSKDSVIRTYYAPDPAKNGMSNMDYFLQEGSK